MTEAVIRLPPKLIPVFQGRADVRGAYGGRGSAKTRSFAKMAAFVGMRYGQAGITGQILCARQYMNSLDDSSLEEVKRAIEDEPQLSSYYEVGEKFVKSRDGRVWFSFAGLDRSIDSVKSKGRILLCWVDEAEPVTDNAFVILIPTLREEDEDWNAELWVTWNRKRKSAAVEKRFAQSKDPLIKIVELNWRDNPKFPEKLKRERQRDFEERPDEYDHIWEGDYATATKGAYFAQGLSKAKSEGRIGRVAADPLLTLRVHCDIGGTGATSDAFVMWVNQFIGREIRTVDHYEAVGQPIEAHATWLRSRGYVPGKATIVLPHDGKTNDKVWAVSYESAFRTMGYDVMVIPNMGRGAASQRVEAVRRVLPKVWFNEETTESGREALGFYHEKWDDKRDVGLGPDHDWSSHSADAYGLMAVDHEQQPAGSISAPIKYPRLR
jgi:phage terminase large subunit